MCSRAELPLRDSTADGDEVEPTPRVELTSARMASVASPSNKYRFFNRFMEMLRTGWGNA
jgi:hypothetical protein